MGWSVSWRVSTHVGAVSQLATLMPTTEAGWAAVGDRDSPTMTIDAKTAVITTARTHGTRPAAVTRGNLRLRGSDNITAG